MKDEIASLCMSLHKCRGHYAVLLGSGVSRSGGIPTGWEIVLDLVRHYADMLGEEVGADPAAWYQQHTGEAPTYCKLLDALGRSSTERALLLRGYFEPTAEELSQGIKTPTPGHRALARLSARGLFKVFLTTNFDRLLERALEDEGIIPAVISTPDALDGSLPITHARATVIKLHGDYLDTRIKNTPDEVSQYHDSIDLLLDRIIDEYGMIICGWSAQWDTALRRAFERCTTYRYTTYWADPCQLNGAAKELLETRRGVFLEITGADDFFTEVEDKVAKLDDKSGEHSTGSQAQVSATAVARPAANIERPSGPTPAQGRLRWSYFIAGSAVAVVLVLMGLVLWKDRSQTPGQAREVAATVAADTCESDDEPEAVEAVRRGQAAYEDYTREAVKRAHSYFSEATKLDPDYALAHSWLSMTLWLRWDRQWSLDPRDMELAYGSAEKAVRRCPRLAEPRRRLAWILLYRGMHADAEHELREAMKLDPDNTHARAYLAQVLNFSGRPRAALKEIKQAMKLRPHYPAYYPYYLGHAYYLLGRSDDAIAVLTDKALPLAAELTPVHCLLAILHAEAGRTAEARAEVDRILEVSPDACLQRWRVRLPYQDAKLRERYIAGLEQAGIPTCTE